MKEEISVPNNTQEHPIMHAEEIENYGDPGIASDHGKVPKFLIANYIFWPIWGVITLIYFWNGSHGWMDPGYWQELQIAAGTTFPSSSPDAVLAKKQVEENHSPLKTKPGEKDGR